MGDFFNKPLQGADFIKFRDLIIGNILYDFIADNEQQVIGTSMPRSMLGDVGRVVPSGVTASIDGREGLDETTCGMYINEECTTASYAITVQECNFKDKLGDGILVETTS